METQLETKYSKLQDIKNDKFSRKKYFETKVVEKARIICSLRIKMIDLKGNYKNDEDVTHGRMILRLNLMCWYVQHMINLERD